MPYRVTCTKFNSCVFFCNIFQCHLLVRWRRRWRRNVTCLIFLFLRVLLTQLNLRTALVHKHYNFHWNKQTHTRSDTTIHLIFSLSRSVFLRSQKYTNYDVVIINCITWKKKLQMLRQFLLLSLGRALISIILIGLCVCVCVFSMSFTMKFFKFRKLLRAWCRLEIVYFVIAVCVRFRFQQARKPNRNFPYPWRCRCRCRWRWRCRFAYVTILQYRAMRSTVPCVAQYRRS